MSDRQLRVMILMAGPKFDLEWEFGERLRGLSGFCRGALVTTGSGNDALQIGDFSVWSTLYKPSPVWCRLAARIRFIAVAYRQLRQQQRAGEPPEVVVTYDPLLTGLIAWVLAVLARARFVCEVNGDYTHEANFRHMKSRWLRDLKRRVAGRLVRFVLRRADGIRVLYPEQLRQLGYTPRTGQIVVRIPEFVNTAAFFELEEVPRILLVGFPFYVKGVDLAVAAFKRLAPEYPDWKLEIIGYYPDTSVLDAAIDGCAGIFYSAPVLHRKMNDRIGRCAFVIQPSRTEAMGRVLVEAMAAGKPRIGSRIGGIPTVIEDGVDGLLVDAGDVDGLAAAMRRLMEDQVLRRAMGAAGSARAEAEFSVDAYCRAIEAFFRRVAPVYRAS